jgi:hypothetical protein
MSPMRLKIAMPEDMDYQGAFDDIFEEFAEDSRLSKVKTTEFGSLFEITYDITFKEKADTKKFIDSIRCKNGNLKVALYMRENKESTAF